MLGRQKTLHVESPFEEFTAEPAWAKQTNGIAAFVGIIFLIDICYRDICTAYMVLKFLLNIHRKANVTLMMES